jgi:hypothetical protein
MGRLNSTSVYDRASTKIETQCKNNTNTQKQHIKETQQNNNNNI